MTHLVSLMRLFVLLAAVAVYVSEPHVVDKATPVAVDETETPADIGDRKLLGTTTTTTKIAADSQMSTAETLSEDSSETQLEQSVNESLSEIDEARHLMERFYQRYHTTAQVDLVFVLDRSGSVPQKGWQSVVQFVKNVLEHFTVDRNNTRVAVVTFSTSATVDINDLEPGSETDAETKCTLNARLDRLVSRHSPYGYTATHDALQMATQVLVESRSEAKKAVIVVTDGKSNIGPPPVRVASELLALRWDDGVTWNAEKYGPQVEIYAFSVADANTVELESIASRLPAHVFRLSTFSLFVEFARSLHGDKQEKNWMPTTVSKCGGACARARALCLCGTNVGRYECACDPGYHFYVSRCVPCKKGYYKEGLMPDDCTRCPENTTTDHRAATSLAECKPLPGHVRCPALPEVDHATLFYVPGDVTDEVPDTGVACTDVTDGNSCHYACRTGYRLTGPPALICNYSGAWLGHIPTCQIVDCHPIDSQYESIVGLTVRYANSAASTTYDSLVSVTCRRGTVPVGDTAWRCDHNGLWSTPADFHCHPVFCDGPPDDNQLDTSPDECRADKVPVDTECQLRCAGVGFQLVGRDTRVCQFDGIATWNPEKWPSCVDVDPPTVVCPPDLEVTVAGWGDNSTIVHYDVQKPQISDNSGHFESRVIGVPIDLWFPLGSSPLKYEVFDAVGNMGSCIQYIRVRARTVDVERCPENVTATVTSLRRTSHVTWPPPLFIGAGGRRLSHTCSVESGKEFMAGTTHVDCYPRDYPGLPGVNCQFFVHVVDPPCPVPSVDRPPANGALVCGSLSHHYPRACRVHCREGYQLRRHDASHKFVCQWDGTWTIDGPWPDCYFSRRAFKALTENHLHVRYRGSCADARSAIAESFTFTISRLLHEEHGLCSPEHRCSVERIQVVCGEERFRRRRRRRSSRSALAEASVRLTVSVELADNDDGRVSSRRQAQLLDTIDNVVDAVQTAAAQRRLLPVNVHVTDVREVERTWEPVVCRDGEVRDNDDPTSCYACPPGTYSTAGDCIDCPTDTYQHADGASSCLPCPRGSHTSRRAARSVTECAEPCQPGHWSSSGLEPCQICTPGNYQSESGATACTACFPDRPHTLSYSAAVSTADCFVDAPCDQYNGTCDVTSGFRCVRFDDVRERHGGAGAVQCVCTLGLDVCRPTATHDDIGPTSPPPSDVIDDVTVADEDVDGHSEWLLTPRLNDRLIAGDDDAEYDFDLVFVRRQREAASVEKLAWLLPPAQTGFSACLWLRVSATQTGGTILSLGGSERIVTSRDALPGNDQHDVIVTVDNRPLMKMSGDGEMRVAVTMATWNHLCVTWTRLTGYVSVYVNATLMLDVHQPTLTRFMHDGASIQLGADLVGVVSGFALFNEAISDRVISTLARQDSSTCRRAVGSVLSWPDIRSRATDSHYVTVVSGSLCLRPDVTGVQEEPMQTGCSAGSCLNGGTCLDHTGVCQCPAGYQGSRCHVRVTSHGDDVADPCVSYRCLHGAQCLVESGNDRHTAVCRCTDDWTGKHCQVRRARPSCELSPCLNGGTCVDSVSPPYYRCICPSPRHAKLPLGAHCEPLSSCDSMPCPDHSTCVVVDALGAYRCVCDNDDCAQVAGAVTSLRPRDILDVNTCSSMICMNGGQCQSDPHLGSVCRCTRDFSGRYCTTRRTTDTKRFRMVMELYMNHTTEVVYNSVFHNAIRLQVHRMFFNLTGDYNLYVVTNNVRNQVESVTIDCSLIFTRYLDAMVFDDEDLQRILQQHLTNGRLGHFILRRSGYIYEDLSGRESEAAATPASNVGRDVTLLLASCVTAVAVVSLVCLHCLSRKVACRRSGRSRGRSPSVTQHNIYNNVLHSQAVKQENCGKMTLPLTSCGNAAAESWSAERGRDLNTVCANDNQCISAITDGQLENTLNNYVYAESDRYRCPNKFVAIPFKQ